ncbi:MAG: hypothetical protein BRD55_08900 [Bacteroidetes bacterium SW_9_63_38]|nr:MAG: hypothetical protein BRD55_08900 [Bacteroidetes bacterium SW_9_63_38]
MLVLSAVTFLSILLHVGIGWEATVLAGVVGGVWSHNRWFVGSVGVALRWRLLMMYTPFVAPAAFGVPLDTLSALARNIPGEAVVGATVFLGGVLGGLGTAIGRLLRVLVAETGNTA